MRRPTSLSVLGRSSQGRRGILVALALALTAGLSAASSADGQAAFIEGIKAYDLGQWEEVERYMRQAIAEEPKATGKKVRVYGMKFERYLPYYYLGVALFHQNKCKEALAAFAKSRTEGGVGLLGKTNMKGQEEQCRKKLGLTAPPPPTPVNRTRPSPPPSSPAPAPPPRPSTKPPTTPTKPSTPPAFVPPPRPPPANHPQTTQEVQKDVLKQRIEAVQKDVFHPGEAWVRAVDDYLQSLRREPTWAEHYRELCSTLNSARALVDAATREGDVHAVEEAGRRGQEALTAIQDLARKVGVRPR